MSNSEHYVSPRPVKNCNRRYFFIFGCLMMLSWDMLSAIARDKVSPQQEAYLGRRSQERPVFPQVSPEETEEPIVPIAVDPIKVACAQMKSSLKDHVNPLPLVDWLNVSHLPSFFEPTIRSLLRREEYFNAIDSLGKYDLGVQPYGFYSNFKLDEDNFKLTSFGMTVDGGMTLGERWVVGGGLGYCHSNLDWGKQAKSNTVNSLYLGPYVGYVFDPAYIGLTLLGVYNIYNIDRLFGEGKGKNRHEGWDASARLEGGYDFDCSKYWKNFFIQPNADLSYLWVFQNKIEEKKDFGKEEETTATVNNRIYDFFRSRLGITVKKEFHHAEKGILIPSLSVGWALMQPLSQSKIEVTCGESDEETIKNNKYPSSSQVYVSAKVIGINRRGMMLSVEGNTYIASLYPVYGGNLRFEWDW